MNSMGAIFDVKCCHALSVTNFVMLFVVVDCQESEERSGKEGPGTEL